MSLIARTISQLFGGVSQQPAQLRSDAQCEYQDNCWPDVAVGLTKRPPRIHTARLNTDVSVNRAVHFINRDVAEKYTVVVDNGSIKVYDLLTGAAKTVTIASGSGYLASTDPKTDFAFVSVADSTFVVNKSVTVTLDAAAAGSSNPPTGFVYVIAAVARQTYSVVLDGTTYSTTVAADGSNALSTSVASALKAAIPATYNVAQIGSCLKISKADNTAFTLTAYDSYGDTGMRYFTNSVQGQEQLPPNFWTGYVLAVRGSGTASSHPFYVHFVDNQWKETVADGLQNSLTVSTMPHKLVRNADGTFTFSQITWANRMVGDIDSIPAPSFVGQKINNIVFFRERLGLLSGENLVLSRVSDYFNFFGTTASDVLDDDPIDLSVSDTRVSQLYHALPFQEALLVFSDTAQFQLTGGDSLTPHNAKLTPTTRFYSSKNTAPVAAGRDVYFAVDRGGYTSMREYYVLIDGINSDAVDVTAHVPVYVPNNLGGLVASPLMDVLFMFSRSKPNVIYFYKYLWSGDQKVQSAWGQMTFESDVVILGIETIDTDVYFVLKRGDGTYLEKMNLRSGAAETGMEFLVYLDRRYSLTGVYDASTKKTTWTLPYADATGTYQVVLGPSFGTKAGALIQSTKVSSTSIETNGDLSAGTCFVGVPYTKRYRLSQLFVKDNEKTAVMNGKLQLRNIAVSFTGTAFFKIEVTPKLRDKNTYTFTGSVLGTSSAIIGKVNTSSGIFKAPVMTSNDGVVIDLVNDSPLPSTFQSATWEGTFTQRSRKV